MNDLLLPNKSQLEASKARLSNAFKRLESALTTRFKDLEQAAETQQELQQLQSQLIGMQEKNAELAKNFQLCTQERLQLKQAALDVFHYVESSIHTLEILLQDQNANR